jgi:hypothetical protein
MRADNVEPQALRTVLTDAANRVAGARLERKPRLGSGLFADPSIATRAIVQGGNGSAHIHFQPLADPCGSAFCC